MSRGRGRGGASSSSGPQNRIYALAGRHDQESSPNIVIGILLVSPYDVYALIDPGSTLSYVTPPVASKFGIKPELVKPFEVYTPVGDLVIAKRVYRGCIIVVHSRYTVADLIELDMVEFDVIMGMDWLASCHANIDCRSKMVRFQFPREPVLEWKEAEHADHLRTVLRVLQKGKLYAKFSKCEFWLNSVAFLGHIISSEVIRVDTQKIEAVKTWPRPTTPTEIEELNLQPTFGGPSKKDWGLRIVSVGDVQVTEQLSYEETPIAILDRQVRKLITKDVASVKVLWKNNNVEEMT
ncbi:uncharacterized protein [Nicotiana tomentosiformis]|uniref:uncharacterized protein n=1 Tax=Nicotiana tomentosiformis TaxID=4098 RepID=UPI00388CE76F